MTRQTDHHGWTIPTEGETDNWDEVLNAFFEDDLGRDVIMFGLAGSRPDPGDDTPRLFFDTGAEQLDYNDGSQWVEDILGTKYTDSDAVAAVETESTLNIPGTIDAGTVTADTVDAGTAEADIFNDVRHLSPSDGYTQLQAELDDLGTTPGTVVIPPGTIDDIGDNVLIPANTYLRGAGPFSTRLRFADGADLGLAGLLRVDDRVTNVWISDLEVDGNRANVTNNGQEYGFYTSGAEDVRVSRVYIHDCPGYGFDPHADGTHPASRHAIVDCLAVGNGNDGFTYAGLEDSLITGCVSYNNDRHGFNVTDTEGHGNTIAGCTSQGNGEAGFVVQNGASHVSITGNVSRGNTGKGMRIGNSTDVSEFVSVTSNTVFGNGDDGIEATNLRFGSIIGNSLTDNTSAAGNANIALVDNSTRAVLVMGNVIECVNADFGIDEAGSAMAGGSVIVANHAEGANFTNINRRDGSTICGFNSGTEYKTRETVTIASGSTSATTSSHPHANMSAEDIQVTPAGDLGSASYFWVTGPSSGQFTINVDVDPGQDVDFAVVIDSQ